MIVDYLTLKVVLDNNDPENVVDAGEGDYFYREGQLFWLIQKNGSWKRSNIPIKSFTTKYSNCSWYKSNVENWKYAFSNACELWYKGPGTSKKTGWIFISNRRLTNSTAIVPSDVLNFSIAFDSASYRNPYPEHDTSWDWLYGDNCSPVYVGIMQEFDPPEFIIPIREIVTNITPENFSRIEVSTSLYFNDGYGSDITASLDRFYPQANITSLSVPPQSASYQVEMPTTSLSEFYIDGNPYGPDPVDWYDHWGWPDKEFGIELFYKVVLKNGESPFSDRVRFDTGFRQYNPLPVFDISLSSSVDFEAEHSVAEHFDFTASFSMSMFQGTAEIAAVWLEEYQGESAYVGSEGTGVKSDPILFATGSHSGSCVLYASTAASVATGGTYSVRAYATIRKPGDSLSGYDYAYTISTDVSPVIYVDDSYLSGIDPIDYYSIGIL